MITWGRLKRLVDQYAPVNERGDVSRELAETIKTHRRPNDAWAIMRKANELLEGHGVEAIDGSYGAPLYYVNMGDTYDTTLMYDAEEDEYLIGSWGDIVENDPDRFGE